MDANLAMDKLTLTICSSRLKFNHSGDKHGSASRIPLKPNRLSALALSMTLSVCMAAPANAVPVLELKPAVHHTTDSQHFVTQNAPFIARSADPWVIQADDGSYYFIASVPEFDRIELRHAATIQALGQAQPKIIWHKHESGPMSIDIWAPELHKIDGRWYIYYAASDKDLRFHNRMFVLGLNGDDPMAGEWQELGRLKTAHDAFSLDATSFQVGEQRYFIWAQQDEAKNYNTGLVIAKMVSPTQTSAQETIITEPLLDWERLGFKVNEGAAVLIKNGKVFVTYSASATDDRYAMGLLWADQTANLLDPKSWHKAPIPVFSSNPALKRFGPGHNSFVLAEDGKTELMFYHARNYLELQGTPLTDGNRHSYYRAISWSADGMPQFDNQLSDAQTLAK
ncbi:Alpha-N-arabinofuranosidase 2 precursor [Shewanella morhuae]|uniref:Alpha-N-arabinofuranosidase 2 n=2 Tax=Shewanella morhuae TaxID=365591 RepID=A0A379ZY17_9GAMM|nr:Alpha-N-arabinofuranosidase 2 precursor [Shewanella morhuae]SUJ14645.1 Alpha-N-arabinofuranosidase 2 precursor [Shewanella morhuae]